MGAAAGPDIIENGLVLCLDAANRQSYAGSGTTWRDLAGSSNGTLTNGPTFSSANGGSLVFDGTNDYCVGGNTSFVNNFYTISTWFRSVGPPSNNDGSGGFIFAQSSNFDHGIIISHSWLNQRIVLSSNINNGLLTSDNTALNNTIINAVGTYDGSKQRIYINGVLTAERNFSTAPVLVSPAFQIGRWGFGGYERYFNGIIYNIGFYNRALTPTEILQNYNATKGRFSLA
jgi:hypothetical protein